MEAKTTTMIFKSDLRTIRIFKAKHPELDTMADALRVAIQYADAHGALA
jgi:hypothetical protein